MTAEPGFLLHPGAAQDILEIWEFIASDNPAAATRFRENIFEAIRSLVGADVTPVRKILI